MKIMKKTYHTFIILVMITTILSAYTCVSYPDYEDENHHYMIYFENKWDKAVVIFAKWYWHAYYTPCKTEVTYESLWRYDNHGAKIPSGGINGDYMKQEDYFETGFTEGDSLLITIFNADYRFLVNYALSLNDLPKLNFHLIYPPTEDMRGIYMYPAYEEVLRQSMHNDSIQ